VNAASTTTTITSDTPDPSTAGQAVAVAFTVAPNAPGSGTPSGNVTVSDGLGTECTATVAEGTCDLTFTLAGAKTLTATYAGDGNFTGSTSGVELHTVAPGTATSISISGGDAQAATVGSAVGTAPSVLVTDAFTNPVEGVTVTFAVTGGGGSLTGTTPATGSDGIATLTSWQLGDVATMSDTGTFANTVSATSSAGSVSFNAKAIYSYSTHVQPIWDANCIGCHGGLGGLTLTDPSHANLLDVNAACSTLGAKRVATGGGLTAEAASVLMAKMDNTAVADCPGVMPQAGVLSEATRNTVRAWIRNGAPNN
jgi:hypothetical protein